MNPPDHLCPCAEKRAISHRWAACAHAPVRVAQQNPMRDIHIGSDNGVAAYVDAAEPVYEESRPDDSIFRNGDPIFVATAQKLELGERIEPVSGRRLRP